MLRRRSRTRMSLQRTCSGPQDAANHQFLWIPVTWLCQTSFSCSLGLWGHILCQSRVCWNTLSSNSGDYVTPESGTFLSHETGRSLTEVQLQSVGVYLLCLCGMVLNNWVHKLFDKQGQRRDSPMVGQSWDMQINLGGLPFEGILPERPNDLGAPPDHVWWDLGEGGLWDDAWVGGRVPHGVLLGDRLTCHLPVRRGWGQRQTSRGWKGWGGGRNKPIVNGTMFQTHTHTHLWQFAFDKWLWHTLLGLETIPRNHVWHDAKVQPGRGPIQHPPAQATYAEDVRNDRGWAFNYSRARTEEVAEWPCEE